jgi:TetR/AcrR family transcriptional regulator
VVQNRSDKRHREARAGARALQRRFAILRAAGRAFRRHGVAQTGMLEIAREAKLSSGNLYYYFRGKDELLAFCQDHALDRLLAEVEEACAGERTAPARLRRLIRSQVHCMLDDLAGAAAHLEVDALPPRIRERILRKRQRYERAMRRMIQEGVRDRELETDDPALAARAILGAVNWSARWFNPEGKLTPSEIGDQFAKLLVRGLTPHPNGKGKP